MIDRDHVLTMAVYNRWQNGAIFGAADQLDDAERRTDRGAFFGSIEATLNHILWADMLWMNRFAGTEKPAATTMSDSTREKPDWGSLKIARFSFDTVMIDWAKEISNDWLAGELAFYSRAKQADTAEPAWRCVTHFFNHQTHHRGQVHAMLTAAGQRTGDTDLFLMPDSAWDGVR